MLTGTLLLLGTLPSNAQMPLQVRGGQTTRNAAVAATADPTTGTLYIYSENRATSVTLSIDSMGNLISNGSVIGTLDDFSATAPLVYSNGNFSWNGTTSNVPEGSRLYWTDARFNSSFASKTTGDLAEGSNLYYSDTRARNSISSVAPITYNSTTGQIGFSGSSGGNAYGVVSGNTGITTATTTLDQVAIVGTGYISTAVTTDTVTISATLPDTSATNELQNLWSTVAADSGSTVANSLTDTLTVEGGTGINTAIVGDTLTINYTGGASADTYVALTDGVTTANASGGDTINFAATGIATVAVTSGASDTVTIGATEVDGSVTNEIQTLGRTGDSITLTSGGSVDIGDKIELGDLSAVAPATYDNATGSIGWSGTTDDVGEGDNLYYTDARARAALSGTAPINYNSSTGAIGFDTGTTALTGYLPLVAGGTVTGVTSFTNGLNTPSSTSGISFPTPFIFGSGQRSVIIANSPSGHSYLDLDADPASGTGDSIIRFFGGTNTTGLRQIWLYNGDSISSARVARFDMSNLQFYPDTTGGGSVGLTTNRWGNVNAVTGNFSGSMTVSSSATISGNLAAGTSSANAHTFSGLATFSDGLSSAGNISTSGSAAYRVGSSTVINASRFFYANAGSSSFPSYSFLADQNNGIYYITTDTWGLSAGGTEVVRLTSSAARFNGIMIPESTELAAPTPAAGYRTIFWNTGVGAMYWKDSTGTTGSF